MKLCGDCEKFYRASVKSRSGSVWCDDCGYPRHRENTACTDHFIPIRKFPWRKL